MSRFSYELNSSTMVAIIEGLRRNTFYFYEPNICTLNTEYTISTIVQKDINQANLYRRN